ncbi:MAG: hypothetical protein HUJ98_03575 [Bacteroidaceae bacterium]|nr:hypothetical protein [Bacteroidaceae bacterium]
MRNRLFKTLTITTCFAMLVTGCGVSDILDNDLFSRFRPQGNSDKQYEEVSQNAVELDTIVQYNNAYEKQRDELIALHLEHPSEAYLEAISQIPVEINDPEMLKIVEHVFECVSEEDATYAVAQLRSFEWNEAFVDELVGVRRISIYDSAGTIAPLMAAGMSGGSLGLQLRIESDAYSTTIKWLEGGKKYKYLTFDDSGLMCFSSDIKDGDYDSLFSQIRSDSDGKVEEVTKGIFEEGKLTGTLTVIRDGRTYEKDMTDSEYTIGVLLGISDYEDFLAYDRASAKGVSLEEFEKKLSDKLDKNRKSELTVKTDILTLIPDFKEAGTETTPTPAPTKASSDSTSKKNSNAKATPAPTPTFAPVLPVNPDSGNYSEPVYEENYYDSGSSNDSGTSYDPPPAPPSEPDPGPSGPEVEETYEEGAIGTETGFYD